MVTSTGLSRYCVCAAAPRTFVISRGSEGCGCPRMSNSWRESEATVLHTDRCHSRPDLLFGTLMLNFATYSPG
jgi:hypothetical protein